MTFRLLHGDILSFCRHYQGEPFHALLCDPPYHLASITKRFGKPGSTPAKGGVYNRSSAGFMSKDWDSDIAFHPETWHAIGNLLYPGAFGMAFGGSRTAHRMAVAIEDAGFIIHPMMGWVYGSGFCKATRVRKDKEDVSEFLGHRYGGQALKPAFEPIVVFQRPYEGKPVENIVKTGAGALNIDGGRIGTDSRPLREMHPLRDDVNYSLNSWRVDGSLQSSKAVGSTSQGRWPANFVLTHSPECKIVGYKDQESYQINRFTNGAKPFGEGAGHEFETEEIEGGKIPVWECVEGCPAKGREEFRFFHQSSWAFEQADPFIYQAKVSPSERNAGLSSLPQQDYGQSGGAQQALEEGKEEYLQEHIGLNRIKKVRNPHPTLKPISLCKHLASLLLPPDQYAPRRILTPFAGTGSEMIGAFQAGWDCAIGIELESEYVDIGQKRIDYWLSQGVQLSLL